MTEPALTLQSIHHSYGEQTALSGITLELRNQTTALIGVNGAGKTTLLSIASGALKPSAGSVLVNGRSLYERRTRRSTLSAIALMPQNSTFPSNMTAREVVEYLTWMRGVRSRDARVLAAKALDAVLLGDRADSKVRDLSGGMRRRVALAQAIATRPSLLLLDEPSTGLDPEQRHVMVDRLRELDTTILLSSHIMEDVADLADRIVVIDAGAVAFDGTIAQLCDRAPDPAAARAAEFGFLSVLTATSHGAA